LLRPEDQIGQRRRIDRFNLVERPVVSKHRSSLAEKGVGSRFSLSTGGRAGERR
jgi:hypothetical protein